MKLLLIAFFRICNCLNILYSINTEACNIAPMAGVLRTIFTNSVFCMKTLKLHTGHWNKLFGVQSIGDKTSAQLMLTKMSDDQWRHKGHWFCTMCCSFSLEIILKWSINSYWLFQFRYTDRDMTGTKAMQSCETTYSKNRSQINTF